MKKPALFFLVLAAALRVTTACPAAEFHIARALGIAYLPMFVMESENLVEAHALKRGLKDIDVKWITLASGDALNDALISGSVDIAVGGIPSLITLWTKTRASLGIKGIAAMSSMPMYLNSRDPSVRTIRDFKNADKIALPGVKISVHAVTLEMAAAKEFGIKNFDKLDPLTVTLSHSAGVAAFLAGRTEITAHFTSPPFQNYELANPAIHKVLSSFEVLGGSHTFSAVWTTSRFRTSSKDLYLAFLDGLEDAVARIKADPRQAAKAYLAMSRDKSSIDEILKIIEDPEITFTTTPERTMNYADFLFQIGRLNTKPDSWKDIFFDEINGKAGS